MDGMDGLIELAEVLNSLQWPGAFAFGCLVLGVGIAVYGIWSD